MNREELAALRDAVDTVPAWPDAVRDAVEGRGAGAGPYDGAAELKPAAREPEPQPIEPGAQSRWIKPLSCYERRETTVVEGLRYG
jgi:hypothetical protein